MALPGTAKGDAAAALTSLLVGAAGNAGLRTVAWLGGEGCTALQGERPELWEITFEARGDLPAALRQRPPVWRPGGVRVVVSDFLWPEAPETLLGPLCRGAASVALVQLLARRDQDPEVRGPVRLEDAESDAARETHLPAALAAYRQALGAHGAGWLRAARGSAAPWVTVTAEDFLEALPGAAAFEPLLATGVLRWGR
jgi:hypothetical protein